MSAQEIRLPRTRAEIEAAAQKDSNDAAALYMLGLAYWRDKRYADAEAELRTAVAIEPRFAPAYLAIAYLPFARHPGLLEQERKGEVSDSLHAVLDESFRLRRRAFLIDPLVDLGILGAIYPLRGTMIVGSPGRGQRVVMPSPFDAFVSGHYHLAFLMLDIGMASDTGARRDSIPDAVLWYHGLSAGHIGAYATAAADLQVLLDRSLKRERSDSIEHIPLRTNDYRYVLALMEQRAGRPADAINLYQEALANDLGLFMAHVQMGRIYEGHKMWDQAVAEFQDAIATNPDDSSLLLDLGVVLREAGRLAESEEALRRAMAASPRDARIPYHLGLTDQGLGKTPDAREAFTRFLSLAPSRYRDQIADAKQRLAALP